MSAPVIPQTPILPSTAVTPVAAPSHKDKTSTAHGNSAREAVDGDTSEAIGVGQSGRRSIGFTEADLHAPSQKDLKTESKIARVERPDHELEQDDLPRNKDSAEVLDAPAKPKVAAASSEPVDATSAPVSKQDKLVLETSTMTNSEVASHCAAQPFAKLATIFFSSFWQTSGGGVETLNERQMQAIR